MQLFKKLLVILSFLVIPSTVFATCSVSADKSSIPVNTTTGVLYTLVSNTGSFPFFDLYIFDAGIPVDSVDYDTVHNLYQFSGGMYTVQNFQSETPEPEYAYMTINYHPTTTGTYNIDTMVYGGEHCPNLPLTVTESTPVSQSFMDTQVKQQLATSVTSFASNSKTQLMIAFGLGILCLVTILLVFKSIHWFGEIASGKKQSFDEMRLSLQQARNVDEFENNRNNWNQSDWDKYVDAAAWNDIEYDKRRAEAHAAGYWKEY